jgi:hypothetical protein
MKHLEGDLEIRPLPAEAGQRRESPGTLTPVLRFLVGSLDEATHGGDSGGGCGRLFEPEGGRRRGHRPPAAGCRTLIEAQVAQCDGRLFTSEGGSSDSVTQIRNRLIVCFHTPCCGCEQVMGCHERVALVRVPPLDEPRNISTRHTTSSLRVEALPYS